MKGDDIHPLYAWLTDRKVHPKTGGDVQWNFQKYLVGTDGKVLKRFDPPVDPQSREVLSVLEAALKEVPAKASNEKKASD